MSAGTSGVVRKGRPVREELVGDEDHAAIGRAQEERIHHPEHRRVDPDAERERQHHADSERRRLEQPTHSVTDVLHDSVHDRSGGTIRFAMR